MLNPDKLKIDDRNIQQLLLSMLDVYKQIPFEQGEVTMGKWDELFKDQLIYFWVDIHQTGVLWWQKEREIIMKNWKSRGKIEAAPYLQKLLNTVSRWHEAAERYQQVWVIKELESCMALLDYDTLKGMGGKHSHNKEVIGRLGHISERVIKEHGLSKFKRKKRQSGKELFDVTTDKLLNGLVHVQNELLARDWDDLVSTENHPPHIGLMYGFLKAYQQVQKQVNSLPKRHLDYYYRDILQQRGLSAIADVAYVFFQLSSEIDTFELPYNTQLLGGTDQNGNQIKFNTTSSCYLTNATMADLRTLWVHASDEISPLKKMAGITGIYQNTVDPARVVKHTPHQEGWPLFGDWKTGQTAALGWAWASPVFQTQGGKRTYDLTLHFTDESADEFRDQIHTMAESDILSAEELLFKFFDNTLDVSITVPDGWHTVKRYAVLFSNFLANTDNSIRLSFQLAASDQPWVAYKEGIHMAGYDTTQPLLQIILKEESVYFPYSLLRDMLWEQIEIAIKVEGCTGLQMWNKHGLADPSSPVLPFGVNPLQNDTFSIGGTEWIDKHITEVDVDINWVTLPSPNFTNYYKDYETITPRDEDFQVSLPQAAVPGSTIPLFETNKDGELLNSTSFKGVALNKKVRGLSKRPVDGLNPEDVPSAFVQMKLSGPAPGFGEPVYNEELILFSQRKARDRRNRLDLFPPKVPFIPKARSIKVNYQSVNRLMSAQKTGDRPESAFDLFHIHPHGIEKVGDESGIDKTDLLPRIEARGYLFLGMERLIPRSALCLFIKLEELESEWVREADFRIEYLNGRKWHRINKDDIMENTLMFGGSSGMIIFRVPGDVNSDHPCYDGTKKWLRFSVNTRGIATAPKCLLMRPNAALVKREDMQNSDGDMGMPAGTIQKILDPPRAVVGVEQPMHTFGGRDQEAPKVFYQRVAHQLSHKNRMVRPRDYKQMLFERFEELSWIKVATPSEYPESVPPGHVHVIVLPRFFGLGNLKQLSLKNGVKEEIWNYVKEHSYPGVQVEVMSPKLEIVQVYTDITLNRLKESPSMEQLTELINRQIAPWAYSGKDQVENVQRAFNTTDVLNALNRLKSVWKVEVCEAVQIIQNGDLYHYLDTAEGEEVLRPSTYRSIFVPAVQHKIRFVEQHDQMMNTTAIGNMIIGTDLIIKEKTGQVATKTVIEEENGSGLYLVQTNKTTDQMRRDG